MTRVNYEILSFWDLSNKEQDDIVRIIKKTKKFSRNMNREYMQ